jgi:hypothetical protein
LTTGFVSSCSAGSVWTLLVCVVLDDRARVVAVTMQDARGASAPRADR